MSIDFSKGITLLLKDRRKKPFIRTGKRKSFDRRESYRVGSLVSTFLNEEVNSLSAHLKNISDTGACVQVEKNFEPEGNTFELDLSPIYSKKVECEINWVAQEDDKKSYGLTFLNLSDREKREFRERLLLNEDLLLIHAEAVTEKIKDIKLKKKVKSFFVSDIKKALRKLIIIDEKIRKIDFSVKYLKECTEILDSLVAKGDKLDRSLNNEAIAKEIKSRTRLLIGYLIYQAKTIKRALEKPRGYPGDHKMLEIIYNNIEISENIGLYLDRYLLDNVYAVAVRNRKDKMKKIFSDFINNTQGKDRNILNLACGSCREIREIKDISSKYKKEMTITCVDIDEEALEFSRDKMPPSFLGNIKLNLIKGNILDLLSLGLMQESFDLIYSIGIADYLQDKMLYKFFSDCYMLLKHKGKLIIAYKDKDKYNPLTINWYCDWKFVARNKEEFLNIIRDSIGIYGINMEIKREPSGVIFFVIVTKK